VTKQTASAHLAKLLDARLVEMESQGGIVTFAWPMTTWRT